MVAGAGLSCGETGVLWGSCWELSFSSTREENVKLWAARVSLNFDVTVEDWNLRIPEKKP